MTEFYQRLTQLCGQNNTTVTATLKDLNVSTSKGTAWKNGAVPGGEILDKLAGHFGVSTDYLLGRTADPAPPDAVRAADMKPGLDYSDLTEEDIHAVQAMIEALRAKNKK